ncbi:hypothetical protein JH06_0633 [Blastocystis sp. subtype 4]|uniref:hypothetical protein n=1 Tax=Blastocystis sp. subtype 4 TaxID=944170 RepID=UPI00071160D4|nr:hypothetical protein JH06_0633 [Blastocystis sp. subtype 4]KNB46295.1 hypothetical protein JH06_0633 [Blastocystis sp. subtype 4]|eukprot:XP_014529723.1 hypothetical protein JH06_0633 [Blastocystis sp. subtype 4]
MDEVSTDCSMCTLLLVTHQEINFLVLKHLQQFADKLPSLNILKDEMEKQHLFGDSVDLDNNTRPLLFEDISNLYQDITPRQLTALVEEGVNHLVTEGAESKEDVDILRPITSTLPLPLKAFYKSLYDCLVDYCKLLSKENETKHQIRDCIQNGNDEETVVETTRFDVPLDIPEGSGLGIILSPNENGVYIKAFSSGPSPARDSGMIEVGDQLCAVNATEVKVTTDAKRLLTAVLIGI